MPRSLVLLLAFLPHGCCVVAIASGLWGARSQAGMPCHGDPLLYPTAELGGLLLAALFLLGLWWRGESLAFRALALALVLSCGSWLAGLALPTEILLSGVSKAGQGYVLLQSTMWLLGKLGLEVRGRCCC